MKKILLAILFIIAATPTIAEADKQDETVRAISGLNARITQMEEDNRRMQGQIEDLDYKIRQVEKKQIVAPAPAAKTESQYQKFVQPEEQEEPEEAAEVEDEKIEDEKPAKGSAEYNKAFIQLGKLKYIEAEKSFKDFITKYPDSKLTAPAYYWLGEILFAKEDYKSAAISYLKSYKADPKGEKAPEAILKTASTLKEMGKKPEACSNYKRFITEFPNAHATLKSAAQKEMKALECK